MSSTLPRGLYLILFLVLIAANIAVYREIFATPVLTMSVLDVGKGDAVLLRSPSGRTLLVDTGPDASILREVGTALPMWQKRIDSVVLTNASTGSAGGFRDVAGRYRVSELVRFGAQGSKSMEAALSAAESAAKGLQQTSASYGALLTFDTSTRITVVAPSILHISYGATSFSISSSTPKGVYTSNGETLTSNY